MKKRYYLLEVLRFAGAVGIFTIHSFVLLIFFVKDKSKLDDSFYDSLFETGAFLIKVFFFVSLVFYLLLFIPILLSSPIH